MSPNNLLVRSPDYNLNCGNIIHSIFDKDLNITNFTQYAAGLVGYEKFDELLGKRTSDIRSPSIQLLDEFMKQDKKALINREPTFYFNINTLNGIGTTFLLTKKNSVIDTDDNIIGIEQRCIEIMNLESFSNYISHLYKLYRSTDAGKRYKDVSYEIIGSYREHGLSKRQSEVAFLFSMGKTAKEVAHLLNIEPKTVEHHCTTILDKLALDRKHDLPEYFRFAGLDRTIPKGLLTLQLLQKLGNT